jgi:hypothetical protein
VPERDEFKPSIIAINPDYHAGRKASATEQLVLLTTSALALPSPAPTVPRDLWTNKVEFLLSVIGYVVDLGEATPTHLYQ